MSGSDAEALLQELVDRLRVGLATRSLHHLADEPADRLRIGLGVADFVRILRDNLVDELFEGRNVGHLLQSARLDDGARIATFVPDDFENVLGELGRNGPFYDQSRDFAQLAWPNGCALNVFPAFIKPAKKLGSY